MQERDISIDDVSNCIMFGEIIENYPGDFPHPSCLIFGYTIHHKVLHTVVGSDAEVLHIITAYYRKQNQLPIIGFTAQRMRLLSKFASQIPISYILF